MDEDGTTTTKKTSKKKTTKKTTTKKSSRKKTTKKRSSSSRSSSSPSSSSSSSTPAETQRSSMIVNYVPNDECRIAFVSEGMLEEYEAERPATATSVGNIYLGTVTNVESAIQAAFVDFGHESNGFLHISDLHPQYFPGEDDETTEQIGRKTPRRERPPIQKCLKKGQKVLVQVIKEGIGTKGPTVTSYLSIPGRYLVMLPQMDKVGVSRKIEDDDLRKKGRTILDGLELPEHFGFILRTAGLDQTKTELKRDLSYLKRLWTDIEKRLKQASGKRQKRGDMAGRLLFAESDLLMRVLRDRWDKDVTEIIIDHPAALKRVARFMKIVAPRSSTRLLHYDQQTPIFHAFGLEEQIQRMHEREVPLPGGGSLVIDEAEALIAIDVNSGRLRKHGDAETTAFETNKQAVEEICRQLRLRDVGGLVVCDLIDMMKRSHRKEIEQRFDRRLKRDRAASKALPISQFGIVEMTRQRMRGSLRSQHFSPCPSCAGRGLVRRPSSVAGDTMRDIGALLSYTRVGSIEVVVSPRVAGELLSHGRLQLTRLEHRSGKSVMVRVKEDMQIDRVIFYAYDEQGADIALEKLPSHKPPRELPVWEDLDGSADLYEEGQQQADQDMFAEEHDEEDPMLEAMPDVEDADEAPSNTESSSDEEGDHPKKRRRRRRGGRGRRRREEGDEGERQEEASDERPEETRAQDESPERESRDGDEEEGEGERRRRRRRRRRGRRSDETEDTGTRRDEDAEDDGVGVAPADTSERGDSWDLTPEEFDAKYPRPNKRVRKKAPVRKKRTKKVEKPAAQNTPAPTPEPEAVERIEGVNGAPVLKKRRRKTPMKRAPAKSTDTDTADPAENLKPVVKKGRSLFGSRRSRG